MSRTGANMLRRLSRRLPQRASSKPASPLHGLRTPASAAAPPAGTAGLNHLHIACSGSTSRAWTNNSKLSVRIARAALMPPTASSRITEILKSAQVSPYNACCASCTACALRYPGCRVFWVLREVPGDTASWPRSRICLEPAVAETFARMNGVLHGMSACVHAASALRQLACSIRNLSATPS